MTEDQKTMQPDQALGFERRLRGAGDPARLAVFSRQRALERLSAAVREGGDGPALITGEPGAGKTWLSERLVDELPAGWRALSVELTSTLDALEFLRLVADALGLPMTDRLGAVRLRIQAALEDDTTEGRNWLIVVDEAHRASQAVWEELDLLAGSIGRPSGFGAMVVMGRTELARELTTRRLDGWAIRLALHVHLMPLDLDEARELLAFHGRAGTMAEAALEALHRDALGNPRILLRLAESRARSTRTGTTTDRAPASGRRPEPPRPPQQVANPVQRPIDPPSAPIRPAMPLEEKKPVRAPSLIPSKPPIRLEDGLVEVGWDGDIEDTADTPTGADLPLTDRAGTTAAEPNFDEVLVEDRYAALQAWTEWSRNRERSVGAEPSPDRPVSTTAELGDQDEFPGDEASADPASSPVTTPATVRAEPSHDHAPYSQLFTRLRQSRQG